MKQSESTVFPRPSAREEEPQQPDARTESRPESRPESGQVTGQVRQLIQILGDDTLPREAIQTRLSLQSLANFSERYLIPALAAGLIERTIPDQPNSRLQKYRLTPKGLAEITKPKP